MVELDPDGASSPADYASPKGLYRRTGGTIDVPCFDNLQPYIRSVTTPDADLAF
jgi:hypothetical protein